MLDHAVTVDIENFEKCPCTLEAILHVCVPCKPSNHEPPNSWKHLIKLEARIGVGIESRGASFAQAADALLTWHHHL